MAASTELVVDEFLREEIRSRAYEIYAIRGDALGSDVSDWLKAEHEVVAQEEYRNSWKDFWKDCDWQQTNNRFLGLKDVPYKVPS